MTTEGPLSASDFNISPHDSTRQSPSATPPHRQFFFGPVTQFIRLRNVLKENSSPMKNIIFDFGNVLVGYRPDLYYAKHFGDEARAWWFLRHVADLEWRTRMDAGESTRQCVDDLAARFPDYSEAIDMFDKQYFDMFTGEIAGMRTLLLELKARPDVHIYGLTNWSSETFPEARRRFSILQLVDDYVVSGDERLVKPDPRLFQRLLDRYGLAAADCTFVDDNLTNVEAARRMGMTGIHFSDVDNLRQQLGLFRSLTTGEVDQLQRQQCSACDWSQIEITDSTPLDRIHRTHFAGRVTLGADCEVSDCHVDQCTIGSGSTLRRIGLISNYIVEHDCHLEGIGEISHSTQPVGVDVMNENGGRKIYIGRGMTVGNAYLWARYRGRKRLMHNLYKNMLASSDPTRGHIGAGSTIHGATALIDGEIGPACQIGYGVIAERFLLGENVKLEGGLRLNDSVVGDNSTLARGEVGNSLIFPAHEQHHNSSFLIAACVQGQSNVASGATLGSNHNGRTPDGELSAGRGFWPGLCVSVKHNCRFASYTLMAKGDYPHELNITLPYALINNNMAKNRLEVMPAYWWLHNMYALDRNRTKFAHRDRRSIKQQHIEFNPFAPDTAEEMLMARNLLHTWTTLAYREHGGAEVTAYGMERGRRKTVILKPGEGYRAYEEMLIYYAMSSRPMPCDTPRTERWINLGGQLVAGEDMDKILSDIETEKTTSWQELNRRLDDLWCDYPTQRSHHAYRVLCTLAQKQTLDESDWNYFRRRYTEIQQLVRDRIALSRQKDADNEFRQTTFWDTEEMQTVMNPQ